MLNKILLAAFIMVIPAGALAASEPVLDRPLWSLEVKGGYFFPAVDNWKTYYGDDKTWHYSGSLAYKLLRQVDVGIDGGMIRDRGRGYAPTNGIITGGVTYTLFPIQAFVLLRGVFSENQWLVPYVGGGWTRMYYRIRVEGQGPVRGSADGYHGRAGLQLQLDAADSDAATNLYLDYGIHHTYLFFEAQYIRAMVDTATNGAVNIGGTSYLAGLLFEF